MQQTTQRLLWLLAGVVLSFFLLFFVYRGWLVLPFPHQVEYGEGSVLDGAQQLARGQLPYKPIGSPPWNFSVYTPGFLAASAVGVQFFPKNPWLGGRLLSFGSALALACLLYFLTRSNRQSRSVWLVPLVWLASPYVFRWATFFRPDLFALAWSAGGIVLVERAIARDKRSLVALAALCFVAAFWSKQSFVAAPLAAALGLWGTRRAWLRPFVATGVLGGLAVGTLLWVGSGPALWENLVAANANPFSWVAVARFYRSFLITVPVLVALAGWQVVRGNPPLSIVNLYFGLSVLVSLSIGKAGAWENYFLEPLWAACVLAGRALGAWEAHGGWRAVVVPALVLVQLALFVPGFERHSPGAERAWLEEMRDESLSLTSAVSEWGQDAEVWSEHLGVLAESGRTVPLHSFVYTQLARQGLWDEGPLVDRLAQGEGALLIQRCDALADPLQRDRWSRAMLDAGERGWALSSVDPGRDDPTEWCVRRAAPFAGPDAPQPASETIELLNWMVVEWSNEAGLTDGALWKRVPAPFALLPQTVWTLHLLWRSQERIAEPLTVSVQLFAQDGTRVWQDDRSLRNGLGGAWPEGALVRHEHPLYLQKPLAPGAYHIEVALYEGASGVERGRVRLEGFKVAPTVQVPTDAVQREATFGPLRLLAHDPLPPTLTPGGALTVRGWWRAEETPTQRLTTFLHLTGPDGVPLAQSDFPPPYPPTLWSAGETAEVRYDLALPPTLPAGTYEVRLGWYDSATQARLAAEGAGTAGGTAVLGTVWVEP